jgi:pantoate kinase
MTGQIIELDNGILVEVEAAPGVKHMDSGTAARVQKSIDTIRPLLLAASRPVLSVLEELNKDMTITDAKVEIGLGFGVSGGVFIAKGEASANLKVTLTLAPK